MMHRQGRNECRHGSNNNKIMTSGGCTGVLWLTRSCRVGGIAVEDLYVLQRPIGCPYDLYRRDTGNREKYNIQYHGHRNPERNVYNVEESFYRSRVVGERCTF